MTTKRIEEIKHMFSDFTIHNSCVGHDQILLRPDLHQLPLGSGADMFMLDDGLVVMRMTEDSYSVWYPDDDEDDVE